MKIDGVTMPMMKINVTYGRIEKEDMNESGTTLTETIRLGKRTINFSSRGMTCSQMATLLTAVNASAEVVISEFHDPQLNANGTGTFKTTQPTADDISRRNGDVAGWANVRFTATEV